MQKTKIEISLLLLLGEIYRKFSKLMSKLIVSTDPGINGGIAKINSLLLNNFAFGEYLIISNKKPDHEINSTTWLKSYGKAPIIFFNILKLIKIRLNIINGKASQIGPIRKTAGLSISSMFNSAVPQTEITLISRF